MIEAAVGLPGSGKSLWSVGHRIIPALKAGRLVVTNVPLILRGLRIECGEHIDPLLVELKEENLGREPFSHIDDFKNYDSWRMYGDKGQGPLFVIDECHVALADCIGLAAGKNPVVDWFAKHRHTGSDVVLMTQMEKGVPSAIRGRVEIFYKFIRKGFMGRDNAFRMNVYDNAGVKMPNGDDGTYNKDWFKCYRSHVPGAAEGRAKRPSIWSAPQFKVIGFVFALLIAYGVYYAFWGKKPSLPSVKKGETVQQASAPVEASAVAPVPGVTLAAYDQQIAELDRQIQLEQRTQQLARVKAGCDIAAAPGGGFVAGVANAATAGGGGAAPCKPAKELRFMHDQVAVKISGHMALGGHHTYWFEMMRDGRRWIDQGEALKLFGFDLVVVNPCLVMLRGERGVYRVTCEALNVIGYEDAVPFEKPAPEAPRAIEHVAQFDDTGSATLQLNP